MEMAESLKNIIAPYFLRRKKAVVRNREFAKIRKNIFPNSVKRHICGGLNSWLGHDLPISVNNREISPFREGFIFMKLCILRS